MIMTPTTYAHAGVNIDAADQTVNLIRTLAHNTFNSQVLTGIGSFGAGYALGNQVLVSSADGVGMILCVPDRGQVAIRHLTQAGIPHWVIGSVEKRIADEPQVQFSING